MSVTRALWPLAAGLAFLGAGAWAAGGVEWRKDYRAAYEEAQERNAPVFIFLGQDT